MLYKELQEYQQKNYIKLRDYLKDRFGDSREDSSFNVEDFAKDSTGRSLGIIEVFSSGSVCCALGWGMLAGCETTQIIKPKILSYYEWDTYCNNAFGTHYSEVVGQFIFSSKWSNDIQESITRIQMYIDGFDPSEEDWSYGDLYTVSKTKT